MEKDKFLEEFNRCYNFCNIDKNRIIALYRFVISIKMNDIFARGFSVDEKLREASSKSNIILKNKPKNLMNLYDVILESNLFYFLNSNELNNYNYSNEFFCVFNSDFSLPKNSDYLIGFLSKESIIQNNNLEFYNNLDDNLKFLFKNSNFFIDSYIYIKYFILMYDLMMQRIIHGTKTVMQKENSDFQSRNEGKVSSFINSILPNTKKQIAESEAFLENNLYSVLTVPANTKIDFPTADLTQIEKAYVRAVDMMLAVFRIPATKFFGMSPTGFNSTGNLEILNYEQSLDEIFNNDIKPILQNLQNLIKSKNSISAVSFYKLKQLDEINLVRSTTNSKQIVRFCDEQISAISEIKIFENNEIEKKEEIV